MRPPSLLRAFTAALIIAGAASYSTNGVAATTPAEQQRTAEPLASFASKPRIDRCGVKGTPADQIALIEQSASAGAADKGGVVSIPIYWHIITTAGGGGDVSGLVPAQLQVLNEAFAGSKFAFQTQSIEVIANDNWFFAAAESPDEVAMKNALRRGGPDSLNIYTTGGDVYLGWATLPFYYKFQPGYDGVVLWWAALPGTGLAGASVDEPDGVLTYDQGDTGTHEVGHWLGLDHTFANGGCRGAGDKIKDTPTEAEPQFFCAQRDSCVGASNKGDDPITNFMDYVDDVCMDHFTPDQTKRMRKHWHAFRDKKARTE
jgi:hypothetical protein